MRCSKCRGPFTELDEATQLGSQRVICGTCRRKATVLKLPVKTKPPENFERCNCGNLYRAGAPCPSCQARQSLAPYGMTRKIS